MSEAIDELRQEHGDIFAAIRVLEQIDRRIERGDAVPSADMKELVLFFKEFADLCHHGKEEGILFSRLEAAGAAEGAAELEAEHKQGRQFINGLEAAAAASDAAAFATAGRQYAALMRKHIEKETLGIFAAADKTFSAAELDQLAAEFKIYEREVIGENRHTQLEQSLTELKDKYR